MRSDEQIDLIAQDCVHFKGDRPCQPHMKRGVSCRCSAYRPQSNQTLIIQLSNPTRVIRSNALVQRLKADEPDCHVSYLTDYPELLSEQVDQPLANDGSAVYYVQTRPFDRVINLDLDPRAGAVMNAINAAQKKGYYLRNDRVRPIDADAQRAYLSHLFPYGWSVNDMTEVRELFQLCGLAYHREIPSFSLRKDVQQRAEDDQVTVALCGSWAALSGRAEQWSDENWWSLAATVHDFHMRTVMIGPAESRPVDLHEISCTGALGWPELLAILPNIDVMVTSVPAVAEATLAMRKRAVLLASDRTARYELALYHGRGIIAAPDADLNDQAAIDDLTVEDVFQATLEHVNALPGYEGQTRSWTVLASVCDNIEVVRKHIADMRHLSN